MILEHLEDARKALATKTKEVIEAETAAVWGARAVAAFERFHATGDMAWFVQAIEYEHESVEHAASGPPGTLEQIQFELAQTKQNIWR